MPPPARPHRPRVGESLTPHRATAPQRALPSRAPDAPRSDDTARWHALQRTAGNAALLQALARHGPGPGPGPGETTVQRSTVHEVLRSPGRPLDDGLRTEMEARLGADFSDVRLHTGTAAQRSATEIGARAYTSGSRIVVGAQELDGHTLAHELTHVLQQRSGEVAGTDTDDGLRLSDPSDRFEREADAHAARVMRIPLSTPTVRDDENGGIGARTAEQTSQVSRPARTAGRTNDPNTHRGGSTIQRAIYLHDPQSNTYRDSTDEQEGMEMNYAYIGKDNTDKMWFITYNKVSKAKKEFARLDSPNRRHTRQSTGPTWFDQIIEVAQPFYLYRNGVLQQEKELSEPNPGHLPGLARLAVDVLSPKRMPEGWGDRTPPARGFLYGNMPKERAEVILGVSLREEGEQEAEGMTRGKVTVTAPYQEKSTEEMEELLMSPAAKLDMATLAHGEPVTNVLTHQRPPRIYLLYLSTSPTKQTEGRTFKTGNFKSEQGSDNKGKTEFDRYKSDYTPKAETDWIPGREITPKDREIGQIPAMRGWNALGFVRAANRFDGKSFNLNQDWEWLHIRGAALGGETKPGNLVPGTFSTNTAMIPFERMIKNWASIGPATFWASFRIAPPGWYPNRIELWIEAKGHQNLGDLPKQRLVAVDPQHGKVVDKLASEIVKRNVDLSVSAEDVDLPVSTETGRLKRKSQEGFDDSGRPTKRPAREVSAHRGIDETI